MSKTRVWKNCPTCNSIRKSIASFEGATHPEFGPIVLYVKHLRKKLDDECPICTAYWADIDAIRAEGKKEHEALTILMGAIYGHGCEDDRCDVAYKQAVAILRSSDTLASVEHQCWNCADHLIKCFPCPENKGICPTSGEWKPKTCDNCGVPPYEFNPQTCERVYWCRSFNEWKPKP